LEGIEGSGKTTQSTWLAERLTMEGYEVLRTREPGGTPLAEALRHSLLNTTGERLTPWTEVLLVLAARTQHVAQVIRPALERGAVVLCDRYIDSTLAYQAYGRGLPAPVLLRWHRQVTDHLMPDLTLLFDVPVAVGLHRRQQEGTKTNRLDDETRQFHERVLQGFRDLARKYRSRIRVIPSERTPEKIHTDVSTIVSKVLAHRPADKKERLMRRAKVSAPTPHIGKFHAVR
jgi:dTMP kinase